MRVGAADKGTQVSPPAIHLVATQIILLYLPQRQVSRSPSRTRRAGSLFTSRVSTLLPDTNLNNVRCLKINPVLVYCSPFRLIIAYNYPSRAGYPPCWTEWIRAITEEAHSITRPNGQLALLLRVNLQKNVSGSPSSKFLHEIALQNGVWF